jgi:hypothetical protein
MTAQKMSRDRFPLSFGVWKPVDHVVVALPSDGDASEMEQELGESGFGADAVLHFSGEEMAERLEPILHDASGAAGFGSEIEEMRRYEELARDGAAWLVVHAPEDQQAEQVATLAKRHHASVANKYHRLAVEDLL